MKRVAILFLLPALMLSGCAISTLASTAAEIVTLPVKAVSAGVDAVTTTQREADENRGRELRKQEEERGRQLRLTDQRCRKGKPISGDVCPPVQPR